MEINETDVYGGLLELCVGTALAADQAGIPRKGIRYVQVDNRSPYTEVTKENINSGGLKNRTVELNSLYRFSKYFQLCFIGT